MNLQDRDNFRTKDNRPVPKVSFVRRFDCITVGCSDADLSSLRYAGISYLCIHRVVFHEVFLRPTVDLGVALARS